MTIKLADAARYTDRTNPMPHQLAAWNKLQGRLTPQQLDDFAIDFRAAPIPPPAPVPGAVPLALLLIKEFEGCKLDAYPDPGTGGEPWTIGWGSTAYYDGSAIKKGDRIEQNLADAMLSGQVQADWSRLNATIPSWPKLAEQQQAALLSFAYNVGVGFYGAKGFDTITACLRDGQLSNVPSALMLYVNPGSGVEAGLRRRREAEGKLWASVKPKAPVSGLLKVPYFSQLDNKSGTGYRECFSSSCAMIAAFHGVLKPATDDAYNLIRQQFGDSTDNRAQVEALRKLGLVPRFVTNAAAGLLEAEINAGRPVAVGWLHKGPVTAPTGGGHWTVAVGFDGQAIVMNDPNGEADMVNGGYVNHTGGAGVRYSRRNWLRRWEVDGPGTGWAVLVRTA